MKQKYKVVSLPGEGVGPEVVAAAERVANTICAKAGIEIEFQQELIGQPAMDKYKEALPKRSIEACQGADGILFGAVASLGLLELRAHFEFFANLRPVKVEDGLLSLSSLRPELAKGVDMLFVRELVSGIYYGPRGKKQDKKGEYSYHTMLYRDEEIRRVARVALEQARKRRGNLLVVHKENALPQIRWRALTAEVAQDYPDVELNSMLADTVAMELVRQPCQFDVILASNLFGDILSDLGGAITGSMGLLPSASLNDSGFGLYEPVHGTAPTLANKNIANPIGAISSIELMLRNWGLEKSAQDLSDAIQRVIATGIRTKDLASEREAWIGTREITDAIIDQLGSSSISPIKDKIENSLS